MLDVLLREFVGVGDLDTFLGGVYEQGAIILLASWPSSAP